MSLSGVVFKHPSKLQKKFGAENLLVDEDGQAYPKNELEYPEGWEPDEEIAFTVHIGNIALLSDYREEIARRLPNSLIQKILLGEVTRTDLSELSALEAETDKLEAVPNLHELLGDLRTLIRAARQEPNPIAWV